MKYIRPPENRDICRQRNLARLFSVFVVLKLLPIQHVYFQYLTTIIMAVALLALTTEIRLTRLLACMALLLQLLCSHFLREDGANSLFSLLIVVICWMAFWGISADICFDGASQCKVFDITIFFALLAVAYPIRADFGGFAQSSLFMSALFALKSINTSFYANSNNFGFVLYLAFCLSVFQSRRSRTAVRYLITAVIGIALLLTFSRTSIMAAFLFCAVFMILQNQNKGWITALLTVGGLLLMAVLILWGEAVFSDSFLWTDGGLRERLCIWRYGWELFEKAPWLGYGFGNSDLYYTGSWGERLSWHSAYLDALISGGVIYFAVYMVAVIELFRLNMQLIKQDGQFGTLYMALLLSYLFYSLFEDIALFGNYSFACVATVFVACFPLMSD